MFSPEGFFDHGGGTEPRKMDQVLMLVIGQPTLNLCPSGPRGPSRTALMLVISGCVRQSGASPDLHFGLLRSNLHALWSQTIPSMAPSVASQASGTLASTILSWAGESHAPGSRFIACEIWIKR